MRAAPSLPITVLVLLAISLTAGRAWAMGEIITDVRVLGAARTDEETVRSIAGVSIGEILQPDTLDVVREQKFCWNAKQIICFPRAEANE